MSFSTKGRACPAKNNRYTHSVSLFAHKKRTDLMHTRSVLRCRLYDRSCHTHDFLSFLCDCGIEFKRLRCSNQGPPYMLQRHRSTAPGLLFQRLQAESSTKKGNFTWRDEKADLYDYSTMRRPWWWWRWRCCFAKYKDRAKKMCRKMVTELFTRWTTSPQILPACFDKQKKGPSLINHHGEVHLWSGERAAEKRRGGITLRRIKRRPRTRERGLTILWSLRYCAGRRGEEGEKRRKEKERKRRERKRMITNNQAKAFLHSLAFRHAQKSATFWPYG